jgi:hypothetical protein
VGGEQVRLEGSAGDSGAGGCPGRRCLVATGTGMSRIGSLIRTASWWMVPPSSSGTCWRPGKQSPPFAPIGLTCCGGSGSAGRFGWTGAGRLGPRPATSAGGCRPGESSPVPTGGRGRWQRCRPAPGRRSVCPVCPSALGDGAVVVLRLSPRRGHRAGHQPVPAGQVPAGRAGASPSQPDGAVRERAQGPLPAEGAQPGPAQHPGRRVQRDLRPAAVAPGPGRWSRSTCPPAPGRRSCCRRPSRGPIRAGR